MSISIRSVDMISFGLTIHYVYLLTIRHLYNAQVFIFSGLLFAAHTSVISYKLIVCAFLFTRIWFTFCVFTRTCFTVCVFTRTCFLPK